MKHSLIALVDVNNFYVSCERVFNPKLIGKPVIVLSNNDGCVISRSNEAKKLGIKMGAPWFQVQEFARRNGIFALSSNYALYADMSNRVMSMLSACSLGQEVYSIDECFLELGTDTSPTEQAYKIRKSVRQWTGLPVCVGIGLSKTQAKLGNHIAKKFPAFNGVCNLAAMSSDERNDLYCKMPASEVWGVGRRLASKLAVININTTLDLALSDPAVMCRRFGIVMEKTIRELNGIPCLALEEVSPPKKQIVSTRSFGILVTDRQSLEESVTLYTSRAAEKLRAQQSQASILQVMIHTSPFNDREPYYGNAATLALPRPTNNTISLVKTALQGLARIYRPGYRYQKAGVALSGLSMEVGHQIDLFHASDKKSANLMDVMDRINHKIGKQTLVIASQGFKQPWKMKQERKSPAYTTDWDKLPMAS